MAEVIGIAASVGTLVGVARATITTVKQASKLPPQLQQTLLKLEETILQLDMLQGIQQYASFSSYLGANTISSLQCALDTNIAEFRSIECNLKKFSTKRRGAKGHVSWPLVGKEETLYQLRSLQEMQTMLSLSLSAMTIAYRLLQFASLQKSENDLKTFSKSPWPPGSSAATAFSVDYQVPALGRVAASFVNTKSTTKRLELAFRLTLPFSHMLNMRTLLSRSSWLDINIRSALRVHRVVDKDSRLHQACESGQLLEVRRLLLENPAAIDDRTPDNESLLQVAIRNRNYGIVEHLLVHGANVNESFGINQTSPLACAVRTRNAELVRLLLKFKADCHHLGSFGWTPLFYLWWGPTNQYSFVDQAEVILRILASRDDFVDTYSGVIDTLEFAAIHMAVMRGTISQMQFLLNLDPTLVFVKGFLDWTAVFVAVSQGRLDMLEFLLPFYDNQDILKAKDARGWTLLHTSATEGDSDVTRHLLKLGADWQALSDPSVIEVPEQLKGRSCTPLEAASATSLIKRVEFLRDVKECCGEAVLSYQELEEANEEWTDAME